MSEHADRIRIRLRVASVAVDQARVAGPNSAFRQRRIVAVDPTFPTRLPGLGGVRAGDVDRATA